MADYGLAPVDYDPFAGDYGQGMSPEAFRQAGNYLARAATGQIAASSPLMHDNYDPSKSFAQNATNPSGVANAANIAMGFSGGGLGTESRPSLLAAIKLTKGNGQAQIYPGNPGDLHYDVAGRIPDRSLNASRNAEMAGNAQAAPYSLQPVDHNPFMPPPPRPARAPMGWF